MMSPSLAPASMNAAITSVYIVIASWTPVIVVSRSATICEIDTFMTLLSSTITNWAAPRIVMGSQRRTAGCSLLVAQAANGERLEDVGDAVHQSPDAREDQQRVGLLDEE